MTPLWRAEWYKGSGLDEETVPGPKKRESAPQLDLFGAPPAADEDDVSARPEGELPGTEPPPARRTARGGRRGGSEGEGGPAAAPVAGPKPRGRRKAATATAEPQEAPAVKRAGIAAREPEPSPAQPLEPTQALPPDPSPFEPPSALPPLEPPDRPGRNEVLTVSQLADRLKGLLEKTYPFVLVRGEISNLRQPGAGHYYFSLKDDRATIRAVMFRGQARLLRFRPENGQEVVARGRVSFYPTGGDAQLVCDFLEPVGAGALAVAFEQLKKKLAAEGLFDPARKRPLPFLPRRIGVVTSPTGAAIRDFLRVLHRRFPGIAVLVAPARVQGDGAAAEIARGLERLSARDDLDLVVVTRGGGSIEDLWAFNEEQVARAIAACRHPVVSAVGHEVDFTIADFVADLRAPTPTGAAELVAPVEADLRASLAVARGRLRRAAIRGLEVRRASVHRLRSRLGDPRRTLADRRLGLDERRRRAHAALRRANGTRRTALRETTRRLRAAHPVTALQLRRREVGALGTRLGRATQVSLAARRAELENLRARLLRAGPRDRILRGGGRLADLATRLGGAMQRDIDRRRATLADLAARVRALSPLHVLARGYAVAFRATGAVLLRADEVTPGERLHLELAEGALEVEVRGRVPSRKGR